MFQSSFTLLDDDDVSISSTLYTPHRWATYKKPTAQTAPLVFADTKANAEKPKELFFANARTENETEKVNLETE